MDQKSEAGQSERKSGWFTSVLLAIAALLLRLLLNAFVNPGAPYLTFFLATATSAALGGFWPGIVTLLLGGIFSGFLAPSGGFAHLNDPTDPYGLLRYFVAGGFVCWICQALISSRDRARLAELRLMESERQLRIQAEALQRSNRDLEQFAFVASHDLREPLRIVNIYSELLIARLHSDSPNQLQQYRFFIESAVKRMEDLIRDVLHYSRAIHSEGLPEVVDANAAAAQAIDILRLSAEETGAEILLEPLPAVLAAAAPLTQVFQNLLSNAIKYRRCGVPPRIRVTSIVQDETVTIAVIDNGIGFDPQFADKIFRLFARLNGSEYEGTGLGLAICKRVIERYGGTIRADGSPGTGSTFSFTLPAAPLLPRTEILGDGL